MDKKYAGNIITFAENIERLLEANFKEQMKSELEALRSQTGKLSLDEIESNYMEQTSKLKKIEMLISSNDIASLQQISTFYMMVMSLDVKPAKKNALLATLIVLCAKESLNISSLTDKEVYLLCNVMINLPLKNYGMYDKIIGTPSILDATMKKAEMLNDQLNILEEVLNYCEENIYAEMDNERYENAVTDCIGIISTYHITNVQNDIQNRKI